MYDYKEVEPKILKFWKNNKLLKKLEEKNKKGKNYFLLDGPPYANFVPHVGHIRNTVYKDLNIRLAFMKGHNVLFQPGFDTHGLPVENAVEKKLNLQSKKDIEKLGVAKFMNICKNSAATNKDLWMEVYDKLGSWYSWKEPYMTYNNSYVESGWWTFKQIWDKGLVYEGKKSVFWCPKCMTALAGYEVTDSYKMLTDPSIYIKFKVKDKNEYLLVYTTTPWTLLSNVAVAAHPEEIYVKVETSKGKLILAKERLELLNELGIKYKLLEEFKGKDLEGLQYESIIEVPQQKELEKNPKAHKVYMSIPILKERVASKLLAKKETKGGDVFEDFVLVTEGTGLVHMAPGHGKTDNEVGKNYNLPEASPLDDEAKFTDMAGQFEGQFVKAADKGILEVLERTKNLLYHTKKEHKYPVCWRCKSPLIFRMSNQWFIKVDPIKQKMLKFNEKVNWMPEYARERFETWILNAEDWNISRQRYWGIPIPIWKCDCGNIKVIESFDKLKKHSRGKFKRNHDLHAVDDVKLWCDKCEENKMERIRDILDVWFDSGIAPWAAFGYPFHNKKQFETHFPVSRINESQDQIRGWFYHLMFCGVAVFDKSPYEGISMPGWVLDDKGQKMSKSVGNVVYAKEGLEDFGADALRFYYMWDIAPYELQRFNAQTLKKEIHRILNILWNVHIYLLRQTKTVSKANITKPEDKWLLSKLNSLIKDVNNSLDKFEYHEVGRNIGNFILNNLSREYIQFVRERVDNNDKAVFYVINECLSKVILLLTPICPFISEEIYQNLKKQFKSKEFSVHLESWPKESSKVINVKLEKSMTYAKEVIQKILSEREVVKLGVRWPVKEALISIEDTAAIKSLKEVIMRQTNVKKLTVRKGKLTVKLDTEMTSTLEKEGYAREIMRKVQGMRKKDKLKKGDVIELVIESGYSLKSWEKEIKNKVGARKVFYEKQKGHKNLVTEDIKGKTFNLSFVKVK